MGDERRAEKVKAEPVSEDPVRNKQADEGDADTSYADRQIAMRTKGKPDRAGFDNDEDVDHMFKGVGDQSDAGYEMNRILDAKVPVAGIVEKVQNLDHRNREAVAKRITDMAKVATGNEMLQIGDLVGLPVDKKLRAALASTTAPTTTAIRAHLAELSREDLAKFLDEPTRKLFEAKFTAPAEVVGIDRFERWVLAHQDLVAWYIRTTPPRAVAQNIMRGTTFVGDESLTTVLNAIGREAWLWALEVDAGMAQLNSATEVEGYASRTNQPDVKKHLESITPAVGERKGRVPGGAKKFKDMVTGSFDVAAVVAAVQDAATYGYFIEEVKPLAQSPYRERLTAAASFEQLEMIIKAMALDAKEQLAWLLESPHATFEALAPITRHLVEWEIEEIAGDAKLLAKLTSKFPTHGPNDFFGTYARSLYGVAQTKPAVRKWCALHADPRDLLVLVTHQKSTIAKMWKGIVDDGVPADWYKGLGTGVGAANDERLRILALNTPDPSASEWIRHTLIGDHVEDKVSNAPKQIDAIAFEADPRKRFEKGLSDGADDLGHRTSELSDDDVAKLRANPAELEKLLPNLYDPWLLRNLLRINPSLAMVLRHAYLRADGIAAYARTRPSEETVEAFADDRTAERVKTIKHPFLALPALREPAVLAKVLTRPDTLSWLIKSTDLPFMMSLLAQPGPGKAAAKILTDEHVDLFAENLDRKQDRALVEKFASYVREGTLQDSLISKATDPKEFADEGDEEEEADAAPPKAEPGKFDGTNLQARQDELELALATGDLKKGLDIVLAGQVSPQNVLAVCRELGSQAARLVGKPEHEETVERLRGHVQITPLAVFPSVPYYAYFHTPTSRAWLFQYESAMEILREVSHDPALMRLIVDKLDANGTKDKKSDKVDTSIQGWIENMPKGTALTTNERKLVKRLFDESRTDIAARKLFEIRFGTRMTTHFTKDELVKLWDMLELVPDAHIEMGAVWKFTEAKNLGYAGVYSAGDHRIDLEHDLINSNKPDTMFDQNLELTKEQLKAAYGYDDMQIKAKVAAQEIEEKKTAKGTRYVIKPVPTKLLDTTVLHEIGHAVDDMLGDRTELVFGLAKWREFGESDIAEFARDLGGWDRVRPDDQTRIVDAWAVWLNSRTDDTLDKFVPANHPALADKYKTVGIVDLARKKQPIGTNLGLLKGEYTIVSHKYQRFYRVPEKTRNSAPSAYAMTAPAEYFAECYAEYYREYKGPGTDDKKGGRLAGWIKNWFDDNVDNLKHNPERRD